jgi:hypothetical protein
MRDFVAAGAPAPVGIFPEGKHRTRCASRVHVQFKGMKYGEEGQEVGGCASLVALASIFFGVSGTPASVNSVFASIGSSLL